MTRKLINFVLFAFLSVSLLFSIDSYRTIFDEAVVAYEQRNYQESLELFKQIAEMGIRNEVVFYNIGNCYFRLNQLGKAILYYERALKYRPNDREIVENLKFVRGLLIDQIDLGADNFIVNLLSRIYRTISLNTAAVLLLISFLLVVGLINILLIFFRKKDKTIVIFFLSILILFFIITAIFSYYKYRDFKYDNRAVMITDYAHGYSGPSNDFTRLFTIHEGVLLNVLQTERDWVQVRLPNNVAGWIEKKNIEKISI